MQGCAGFEYYLVLVSQILYYIMGLRLLLVLLAHTQITIFQRLNQLVFFLCNIAFFSFYLSYISL